MVLVDGRLGEDIDGYLHIFKAGHRSAEVEVFDVKAHVAGVLCADDAVPQEFGGGEVGCASRELARVIDEVATCCQADSVGIRLLWAVVDNNACVRDGSVAWNLFDLVVCEHEDGVSAWRVCGGVALGKVPEFFAESPGPRFA